MDNVIVIDADTGLETTAMDCKNSYTSVCKKEFDTCKHYKHPWFWDEAKEESFLSNARNYGLGTAIQMALPRHVCQVVISS